VVSYWEVVLKAIDKESWCRSYGDPARLVGDGALGFCGHRIAVYGAAHISEISALSRRFIRTPLRPGTDRPSYGFEDLALVTTDPGDR